MLTLIGMTDTYQKIQHYSQIYERIACLVFHFIEIKHKEQIINVTVFKFVELNVANNKNTANNLPVLIRIHRTKTLRERPLKLCVAMSDLLSTIES